jgi:hypothetical protein
LKAVLANSRSEMTLLAWCQGRMTSDGGLCVSVERRLRRPSPWTLDVFHNPASVIDSVPKLMPFATSAFVSPGRIVSRVRCSSSVI